MKIKNHMQHELALSCITELMQHDIHRDDIASEHLMKISTAVEIFEEQHFCVGFNTPKAHSKVADKLADKFLTKIWNVCAKRNLDTHLVLNLINKTMKTCYGESIGFKEG